MITYAKFMGGATETELSGNSSMHKGSKRVQAFWPNSATSRDIMLPKATQLRTGGPHFFICNEGLGNVVVKDYGGNIIVTLTIGDAVQLWLLDNTTNNGIWIPRSHSGIKLATVHDITMDDTSWFASVKQNQATSPLLSVADNRLTLSGEDAGNGWVYAGYKNGEFIPARGTFSVEIAVTELDSTQNLNGGGLVISADNLIDGAPLGSAGYAGVTVFYYSSSGGFYRVYGQTTASCVPTGDLTTAPSESNPYWLKYTATISGTNLLQYCYYRIGDIGSYIQVHTSSHALSGLPTWNYKVDVGPFLQASRIGASRWVKFKRLIVRATK